MKTTIFKSVAVLFLAFATFSCSKNDETPITPIVSVPANGFKYSENGATTKITAPTAFVNGSFNTIIAQNSGGQTIFEINLTGLTSGSYTIDNSNNFVTYVKPGEGSFVGTAGTVVITSNANSKLTGTFNVTAGSGLAGVSSVSGSFTGIAIN